MNFTEMQEAVIYALQDESFDTTWISAGLEAALVFVSSIFPLPYLTASSTVTFATGEDSHEMPTNYHWNVTNAHNITNDLSVTVWPSLRNLLDEFGYTTSQYTDLQNIAVEGRAMWAPFQVKSEQAIRVWYTKKADALAVDANCSCIPPHLHKEVLVNRVVETAYELIEDGVDGKKVNWEFNRAQFAVGLAMLRDFYPRTGEHYTHIKRNSFRV